MASASPSPSGRMLVNFNGNSQDVNSFDTGFMDVSNWAYFRISHTCKDATHSYTAYWSTNGKDIQETISGATKLANTFGTDVLTVQARYLRIILTLGTAPHDAQLQAFFFDSLGAGSLKNLGAGAKIYSLSASGVRSFVSSDASLTVTENVNEIDVTVSPAAVVKSLDHTVPPFANSYSICRDATPVTGDVILNWLTDDNATDGGIVWTAGSNYLTGKATLSGVTLGSAGGTSLVVGGTGPSLSVKGLTAGTGISLTPGANDITIASTVGGSNWTVSGSGAQGYVYPTAVRGIVGGTSLTLTGGNNTGVLACSASTHKGSECALIASSGVTLNGGDILTYSGIYSSSSCTMTAPTGGAQLRRCVIMSSNESTMVPVGVSVFNNCLIGTSKGYIHQGSDCGVCFTSNTTINTSGSDCAILATSGTVGSNSSITGASSRCLILGGYSSTIAGCTETVVIGPSVTCTGNKSFTCNLGSTAWTTNTANAWNVKAPGGAVYYSDDAATTGVSLAAGANSWAAVSDINKKENLQEVCYLDCLEGIANLPVYTYNFIGHTPRCIGPTAQDWNRIFPSTKDPLGIDQQDAIGISLAGIQGLVVWMKDLESRINKLEGKR